MKVCCTYCSVETRSPSERIPAVLRWETARVKNAEQFATDREMPLLLLTARDGLLGKDDLIPPGGVDLSDKEIKAKVRLVSRQLQEKEIQELSFLSNPSNRLAIAYLRLITLACDRAGVNLQVLDHSGRPFAEWTKAYRQAEEAKRRASKPGISVEQVFAELFRLYGLGDGMIWFRRGEAHRDRRAYENALADFRQAGDLFTMKEWRDRAIFEAERSEKQISKGRSLSRTIQSEVEEIERLVRDDEVKKLSIEAICVANESPQASILLSFAAIERIERSGFRFPPDLKERVNKLREARNEIAHGPLLDRGSPSGFKEVLFDTLRFAYPRR